MKTKIASLLLLVLVIGVMSWRDMHPAPKAVTGPVQYPYLAATDVPASAVPDDRMPVTIEQGRFAGGVLKPAGMAPTLFAQRQLSLLYGIDSTHPRETLDALGKAVEAWKGKGNTVIAVFLTGADDAFLSAARTRYRDLTFLPADRLGEVTRIDPRNPPKAQTSGIGLFPRF